MSDTWFRKDGNDYIVSIRVIPQAKKTAINGFRAQEILVRLAAPPVDGKANEELLDFLARFFKSSRRDIDIVSGHTSRNKKIRIGEGLFVKLKTYLEENP